jgi:NitT/TauT family transport system substrate-binding protein
MTNGWTKSVALAGILAAAGVMGTAAQEGEPFRLIIADLEAPLVPNSVMDVAEHLGYFDEEGVNVELVRVQQTPSIIAALQAGEGDMGNVSVDAVLQLVARDQFDLVAVTSPNKSLPYLIASRDTITQIGDLAGKAYGIGRLGSLDHTLTTKVLDANGVDPDSLNYVPVGQPAVRLQALAAGQGIDATTVSIGTWTSLPDKTGLHILVNQDDYYQAAPIVNKVNVVSPETLEAKGEQVEAVVRALTKASRDIAEDPSIWVNAMAELRPDVAREDLEFLAETFGGSWSVNGGMSRSELQATQEYNYSTPDFAEVPRVELEDWVNFAVVDAVLADLGTDPNLDPADR